MSAESEVLRALLGAVSQGGRRGRLLILTYHRVLAGPDPLLPGEPAAEEFSRQMEALASLCRVLPLHEAAERLDRGDLPSRAVCVTFDDGYLNNLEHAAPVLLRLGIPATVFVTQHPVQAGIMWNDLVIEAVRVAPGRADFSIAGLGELALPSPEARARAVGQVLMALKYKPIDERWQKATDLFARYACGEWPRLMLTEHDVRDLAAAGFDIGGHTINHPILSRLDSTTARAEIRGCADWLERLTGRRPATFAYPNGVPVRDFDSSHVQMVRDSGFKVAVSTAWGSSATGADRFVLPRVSITAIEAQKIAWQLGKAYLSQHRG